jgi:hypothetical protein
MGGESRERAPLASDELRWCESGRPGHEKTAYYFTDFHEVDMVSRPRDATDRESVQYRDTLSNSRRSSRGAARRRI